MNFQGHFLLLSSLLLYSNVTKNAGISTLPPLQLCELRFLLHRCPLFWMAPFVIIVILMGRLARTWSASRMPRSYCSKACQQGFSDGLQGPAFLDKLGRAIY